MNISAAHIAHLMPSQDSLSLAGVGTFERLLLPAVFNPERHTMTPPVLTVTFLGDETVATSTALVRSVARAEGLTTALAEERLEQDGAQIARALRTGGTYAIDGLGTLYRDSDGDVRFRISPEYADVHGYCWLAPLALSPLDAIAEAPVQPEAPAPAPEQERRLRRTLRVASTWAAAIVVFAVVAAVTVLTNRYTGSDDVTMAGGLAVAPAVHAPSAVPAQPEPALVLVFRTPSDGVSALEPTPLPEHPARQSQAEETPTGAYCLVVASLANALEARQYMEAHASDGYPLHLLETQGRYRVYALSGDDASSLMARARATGLTEAYPSVWVCRRP